MSDDIEDRVTALEMTVTHQEQTINDLSDMISQQWDRIEALKGELERLDMTKADVEPEEDAAERPPHY